LWFHEKRTLLLLPVESTPSDSSQFSSAGSGEKPHLVRILLTAITQNVIAICEARSAIRAYFYFDFRDLKKQTCLELPLSAFIQDTKVALDSRVRRDGTLNECLRGKVIIMDALDECPNSSRIPSPRNHVCRLLLKCGANVVQKDDEGTSPLRLSRHKDTMK
jgi:hypothetical protein